MEFVHRAQELREETVAHRRWFHQNAEVGLEMPMARDYLMKHLKAYGLTPKRCGQGVIADLGSGGKRLLLRADMDALPVAEESGLEFACTNGYAHACGHDCHAAMLLTAAKLLKERERDLRGTVRLMFQPAEETLEGCRDMIAHGVLEPRPDAAMALHVTAGITEPGRIFYPSGGEAMLFSVENFTIRITGKGSHGAYPHLAVDPIHIGVQIYVALQALIAREADPEGKCILTVGRFRAGETGNVIPPVAELQGAVRSADPKAAAWLSRRVREIARSVAGTFGGTVQITSGSRIPPLICDPVLTEAMVDYLQELPVQVLPGAAGHASEDFACIAEQVPAVYLFLSAGFADRRGAASAHDPRVQFNEDALPWGAAALAHCACRWLQKQEVTR